jgi:putative hydrolase of the HAD superfamily
VSGEASPNPAIRAVLWDFGGVFTESPFKAFSGFERGRGLREGFLREVNSMDSDSNAWARFERGQITLAEFGAAFQAESAALGHPVRGEEVIALLYGDVRPTMVEALRRCKAHFRNACLTNNVKTGSGHGLPTSEVRAQEVTRILSLFDLVIESSLVGVRKPEPRFYQIALERLEIEPGQAVYLDDLGINLKPARALGMTTIKVESPEQALGELEAVLNIPLVNQ